MAYAYQKGIHVTNAPGQNAQSVADHAFGLMLTAARNIPQKDQEIKKGHWELSMGHEVYKKRLGIIGFGLIGKAIAKRAVDFDNVETTSDEEETESAKGIKASVELAIGGGTFKIDSSDDAIHSNDS